MHGVSFFLNPFSLALFSLKRKSCGLCLFYETIKGNEEEKLKTWIVFCEFSQQPNRGDFAVNVWLLGEAMR